MKLICDTDLLSVFAKVEKLELLQKAFPEGEFLISESVFDELLFSMEEGFEFPERIFQMCEITSLQHNEVDLYRKRRKKSKFLTISKADLRTLIIAKERNLPILSNDKRLLKFAEEEELLALDIYDIFQILFKKEILTEKDIRDIIFKMEEKDKTNFKDKEKIFQ
ncbi:MAG: hypothetical protein ACOCTR_05145 [Candidatus Natronoplasma sp.]